MTSEIKFRRNLAIIISPIIGELAFIIVYTIANAFGNPTVIDGNPTFYDMYVGGFVLFICAVAFQMAILQPIFNYKQKRNVLNKRGLIKTGIVLLAVFIVLTMIPLTVAKFGVKDFLTGLTISLVIWSSYFIPNVLTYYHLYVKHLKP